MQVKQQRLRRGAGKQAATQRNYPHPAEIGRGIKAKSRTGMTSQPPKRATNTQERSGKAQRLRVGVGL
jgi:hypothetical protein